MTEHVQRTIIWRTKNQEAETGTHSSCAHISLSFIKSILRSLLIYFYLHRERERGGRKREGDGVNLLVYFSDPCMNQDKAEAQSSICPSNGWLKLK